MFFVISGYLITGLLLREQRRTGSALPRLLPAPRAPPHCRTRCSRRWSRSARPPLLGRRSDPADRRGDRNAARSAVAELTVVNWRFAVQGTDYFAQGLPPPAPALLVAVGRGAVLLRLPGRCSCSAAARPPDGRGRPGCWSSSWGGLSLVSLGAMLLAPRRSPGCPSCSASTAPWCARGSSARGALLALVAGRISWRARWTAEVTAFAGAAALVASGALISEDSRFPGPWTPAAGRRHAAAGGGRAPARRRSYPGAREPTRGPGRRLVRTRSTCGTGRAWCSPPCSGRTTHWRARSRWRSRSAWRWRRTASWSSRCAHSDASGGHWW